MNLYEINQEILECIDQETGEIIDTERLESLTIAFDEKVENIGLYIKNLNAEAKAIKEEKDSLAARQKTAESKANSLKNYLSNVLQGQRFNSPKLAISYRRSESVEINDLDNIPTEYIKPRILKESDISKTDIKADLKDGAIIPGAILVEKNNIQIK